MPNYKKLFYEKNIQAKDIVEQLKNVQPKMDSSLFSKIVNYQVLPIPVTMNAITKLLDCRITEIYSPNELITIPKPKVSTPTGMANIHVQMDSTIVNRVFSRDNLKRLGYSSKTECIRQFVLDLNSKLDRIEKKEKENEK